MAMEKATFGAGCFWGVETRFGELSGVIDTAVGYEGGDLEHPTYKEVCTDRTGHAEVVQVTFDNSRISSLPGFGDMKLRSLTAVLAKRFGIKAAQEIAPSHPTLGDVDSPQALEEYQAKKRAHKAEMRAKRPSPRVDD